ncbi:MAG: EamA family transporter [Candidatus ainarchaeum sp.]|nr:EamA family transporter [Candidatus ainarchaeum sp.]
MDLKALMDWRALSLVVMLAIGVYSVAFKKFFADGGDWRVLLPVVGVVGIASLVYFAFTYRDVKYTGDTLMLAAIVLVSIGASVLASLLVYANQDTVISIAVPLMSLATLVTAFLAIVFLKETVTVRTWAGIILAVLAVIMLSAK